MKHIWFGSRLGARKIFLGDGMRALAVVAFALVVAAAGTAGALPFDPEEATQAWIAAMGPEATARSNAYFEGGYWINLAQAGLSIAIGAALLALGWVRGVRAWLERTVKAYPLVALGTGLFFLAVTALVTLPFDCYVGFVRQHEYGLSTQTLAAWFTEAAQDIGITLVLGALGIMILYLIVRAAKRTWWIWGTGAVVLMAAALSFAAPVLLAPIFNTYTPMADSPLKREILEMAQANGVPTDNVYVYDRSRQTSSISANVSGLFGTTRVSLADTLLDRCDQACVKAVMGHELGHYVLGHSYSLLIMNGVLIAFTFALLNALFLKLTRNERWGVRGIDDPAGLPLIAAIIAFIGVLTTPIDNTITRYHEQQADMFGLNTAREPDGFAEAAVLLSEYRKMEPSPLEEFVFYTHPSGWNRIHNSMVWKAHEIELGRLPPSPGGPPPGWQPDFVTRDRAPTAPSPAAPSN